MAHKKGNEISSKQSTDNAEWTRYFSHPKNLKGEDRFKERYWIASMAGVGKECGCD